MDVKDAYEVLDLPENAGLEEITKKYKYLALEWYPDKHNNSKRAIDKFKKISIAYKILAGEKKEDQSLSMKDMLSLFQQVFFGDENDENDSDAWDDDDDDDDDSLCDSDVADIINKTVKNGLTPEEANKNADALIAEEEREKRKAEKRRAKKKRRKEKKKLEKDRCLKEKNLANGTSNNLKHDPDKSIPNSSSSETEEEGIDPCSAFVAVAARKNKYLPTDIRNKYYKPKLFTQLKQDRLKHLTKEAHIKAKENKKQAVVSEGCDSGIDPNSAFVAVAANKSKRNVSTKDRKVKEEKTNIKITTNNDKQNFRDIDPTVLRSRQVAIRGNEMAGVGQYQEAVNLFTEAIKLDPTDHRFYGNRSYCYDRLGLYERALKDAEKAISLSPHWPKGYFRKGRALGGLKKYTESEKAFQRVLELDENCIDAEQELNKVRTLQLTEMGFSKQQAELAIRRYGNVQPALEGLLSGAEINSEAVGGETELYYSDDDDFFTQAQTSHISDDKMDPRNPEGHISIWVGNVRQDVTEKMLQNLFMRFGQVISLRILPEKFCAFINYADKWAAGKAMHALQGYEFAGQRLVIRYPNNPVPPRSTITLNKKPKTALLPVMF